MTTSCSAQARVQLSLPCSRSRIGAGCAQLSQRVLASKTSASLSGTINIIRTNRSSPSRLSESRFPTRLSGSKGTLATGRSAVNAVVADTDSVKEALRNAIKPTDRGIFGCQKAERAQIAELIEQLEALNPIPAPMESLEKVAGEWRLLYTTVQILGAKRTKLGLRSFVNLGDFVQRIDLENKLAVNEVAFNVAGLGAIEGMLTIEATFEVATANRVDIKYQQSTLVPDKLQALFEKNFDLLLAIFNPEGWLELTYVDEEMRIGHDDKGNVFVLEKM
mmetsp:Transcript_11764/g.24678  ORF Transcript_11764/g.24678 Transcript_11764/m.24678 type:complete len:277 (-) Transcript_11764:836-1666(-)